MAVDVRASACSYLRNGAVTVFAATGKGDDGAPLAVRAHIAAVQLCTGHPGLARKPGER